MQRFVSCTAMFALLLGVSLPLAAQRVKIENQGEAATAQEAQLLTAEAVESAIGKAPAGRAQVVFFRSAKSPGAPIGVREASGGEALIDLDPGLYFVATAMPGARSYATADTGPFPMDLEPGRTYYVQVIRNRKGQAQLLRSSADKFQRAAEH